MSPPSDCPICGKPVADRFRPFCSKRCADLDLGQWLKGGYVVPGPPLGGQVPGAPAENADEGD